MDESFNQILSEIFNIFSSRKRTVGGGGGKRGAPQGQTVTVGNGENDKEEGSGCC